MGTSMSARILVVDDEKEIADLIEVYLISWDEAQRASGLSDCQL